MLTALKKFVKNGVFILETQIRVPDVFQLFVDVATRDSGRND